MILIFIAGFASGAEDYKQSPVLAKTTAVSDVWFDINRMNGVMRNNGTWFYDNVLGDWGLEWPKGSGLSPMFAAGQWVGASVNNSPRLAGVIHGNSDFQPGVITSWGIDPPVAGISTNADYRWYVITSDESDEDDWDVWPVSQGAPVDSLGQPLLIGDMTAFCVYNDMGTHNRFAGDKLGVEIGQTVFAFNRADAIGDMIFIKWQLVNKSAYDWPETYFAIWTDADLGNGWDDYVGSDTSLGLGFTYNATDADQQYGSAPPAIGIDFFQGPIVDGATTDTVKLPDGTTYPGKKMLKMTSFIYYNNDDSPNGNPQTTTDGWNYMRAVWRDGLPVTEGEDGRNQNNPPTSFMLTGDPETDTGWLDQSASDRRFMMTTGPFEMPKWVDSNGDNIPQRGEPGVQEIVAGCIMGRGSNNLNSVTFLKAVDEIAQVAYDMDFALPPAPRQPVVEVTELPNEILLTWDERSEYNKDGSLYSATDVTANGLIGQKMVVGDEYLDVTDGDFNFTGYTIYQFSDASGNDAVVYDSYGEETIADATDYTGKRYIRILTNKNSAVGPVGDQLYNGKQYYFGIQARSYCKFAKPQDFPSSFEILTVTPQNKLGVRYSADYDSSITVSHTSGTSDGSVTVKVVDKSKLTGKYYKVTFNSDATWNLLRSTDSTFASTSVIDSVLKNQTNQSGSEAYNVTDGLLVRVAGPDPGVKQIAEINPTTGAVADANLWGSLNNYGRSQHWATFVLSENAGTDLTRMDRFGFMTPKDYELIFTDTDSTLAWDYYTDLVMIDTLTGLPSYVPFTLWKIDISGTRTRLPVTFIDGDGDGRWTRGNVGPYGPDETNPKAFELLYLYDDAAYDPGSVSTYISTNDGTVAPGYGPFGDDGPALNRLCINMYQDVDGYAVAGSGRDNLDSDGYFWGPPHAGETIKFITNKPNTTNDIFAFQAPDTSSALLADQKVDLKKINVVPNPYYGYSSNEINPFNRYVQFTYLPEKCTIRIFDLAGNLVRHLDKNDPTTSLLSWDLKNEYELSVNSGIYVYHVEIPKVGEKIGKIAVFTPNERLDTY